MGISSAGWPHDCRPVVVALWDSLIQREDFSMQGSESESQSEVEIMVGQRAWRAYPRRYRHRQRPRFRSRPRRAVRRARLFRV